MKVISRLISKLMLWIYDCLSLLDWFLNSSYLVFWFFQILVYFVSVRGNRFVSLSCLSFELSDSMINFSCNPNLFATECIQCNCCHVSPHFDTVNSMPLKGYSYYLSLFWESWETLVNHKLVKDGSCLWFVSDGAQEILSQWNVLGRKGKVSQIDIKILCVASMVLRCSSKAQYKRISNHLSQRAFENLGGCRGGASEACPLFSFFQR